MPIPKTGKRHVRVRVGFGEGSTVLHAFISSGFVRSRSVAGAIFSTAAHAGLIAAAVAATSTPVQYHVERDRSVPEHLHFVSAPRAMERIAHRPSSGTRAVSARMNPHRAALRDLTALHYDFDVNVPLPATEPRIDYGGLATHGLAFVDSGDGDLLNPVAVPGRVYTESDVEHGVLPRDGNPKPAYPSFLEQIGIGGAFTVRFVVDTTGRVEGHTMEFPPNAHELFVNAVRKALRRSRFWPAMIAGQRVQQMVEQTFIFRMAP